MDDRPLMTVKQVCERLNISRRTLGRLVDNEKLKSLVLRSGLRKTVRFEQEEVDRYIQWCRSADDRHRAILKSRKRPRTGHLSVRRYS